MRFFLKIYILLLSKKKLVKNEFVVDRINSMPYSSYYHNNMNDKENYSNSFGENISNNKDKDSQK